MKFPLLAVCALVLSLTLTVRAASTTGLWPLSHEDLRALQSQSSKRRKPLRRALRRVLDKADALVSSPVQQVGPMLESGDS